MIVTILAGGRSTRLWPRSRRAWPKQLLDLVGGRSLLRGTYERLRPLLTPEQVFVVTGRRYASSVREELPELPPQNLICEPSGRNTAPCIGLAALYLRRLDPQEVMVVLPADHIIHQEEDFRRLLLAAAKAAEDGGLVTLGIKPSYPETGYGYIERGEELAVASGYPIYRVARFTEKPDPATAELFLQGGRHYWNSGMFMWQTEVILSALAKHLPRLHAQLMALEAALGTPQEQGVLDRVWDQVESISIDYGVMERAQDVRVIPADIGWSDVGSWEAVAELLPQDGQGNAILGRHIGLHTQRSLIYSPKRLVATIGLEDMVIIDTEDALLVCPRRETQKVKELVEALEKAGQEEYL